MHDGAAGRALLLGGVLADRYPRRRLLLVADGVRFAALALLAALTLSDALVLWHVIVLVAVYGCGEALFGPAFDSIVPELVPRSSSCRPTRSTRSCARWPSGCSARRWAARSSASPAPARRSRSSETSLVSAAGPARGERIHMHEFRDLRHVTAVRGLVKNNVDPIERSSNRIAVPHVALNEFGLGIYPRRFSAAVGLRLEIIQRANLPTFAHEKIDNVRADKTRGASDECAFHFIPFCHSALAAASAATTISFALRSSREIPECTAQYLPTSYRPVIRCTNGESPRRHQHHTQSVEV